MRFLIVSILFAAVACGGSEPSPAEQVSGTYNVVLTRSSGTCNESLSSTADYNEGVLSDTDDCVVSEQNKNDATSEITETYTCVKDGTEITYATTLTVEAKDGSRLTGEVAITVKWIKTNTMACASTYDAELVRQ